MVDPARVVPDIEARLVSLDDMVNGIDLLDSFGRKWQDVLSEPGTGEISFAEDDDVVVNGFLTGTRAVIIFSYKGLDAWSMLIEPRDTVYSDPSEEIAEGVTVSGRGTLAVFEQMTVYPTRGPGSKPTEKNRRFDWTSPAFDDSSWGTPKVIQSMVLGQFGQWGQGTAFWDNDFPEPLAAIIGPTEGTFDDAPAGDWLYRCDFEITTSDTYLLYVGVDNLGEVFIDGQEISKPGYSTLQGWVSIPGQIIEFTAGTHQIEAHVYNAPILSSNPTGLAWSIHRIDADGEPIYPSVARSDSQGKLLAYYSEVPAMTFGEVIELLIAENDARDVHVASLLGLTFDAETDSAGEPWPTGVTISTIVGTDMLTFLREQAAVNADVHMRPSEVTLEAFVYGTAGIERDALLTRPTDPADNGSGNLRLFHEKATLQPTNALLILTDDFGWLERVNADSVTEFGRSEARLDLGAVASIAEAYAKADAELAKFARGRWQYTVEVKPASLTDDAYHGYRPGDRVGLEPDNFGMQRVMAIAVTEDPGTGVALLTPTLGDLFIDATAALFETTKKMTNGTLRGQTAAPQPAVFPASVAQPVRSGKTNPFPPT